MFIIIKMSDSIRKTGIVYLVSNKDNNYIGSTESSLYERIKSHKAGYKQHKTNNGSYCTIYKIFDAGEFKTEIIETIKFTDKIELRQVEQFYIEHMECVNIKNKNIKNKDIIKLRKEQERRRIEYQERKESGYFKERNKNKEKIIPTHIPYISDKDLSFLF